jgi:anti-sigma factor RsiW
LARSFDEHISSEELNALVPSAVESGQGPHGLSPNAVREVERHVRSCNDCRTKVSKYRQLVNGFPNVAAPEAPPPGADCPKAEDVDWHEVAAGLWPELKARQLIMHAALCDHCGPMLRAATSDPAPTPQEERLLADLKAPSRPDAKPSRVWSVPRWQFMKWLVPALALLLIVGVLRTKRLSSSAPLSARQYAELAVRNHKQHGNGTLALDVHSDSQQTLNEWFRTKLPYSLALPASLPAPGEELPFRLEGARLLPVGSTTGVYLAYQMQSGPVSLMVVPDSVAVASGGVRVDYKKVSFHYETVEGYKVVTWSVHGLTYAQVSQEGNNTQRSCMVCHSAMRDRDLSQTPTPLRDERNTNRPVWQ